MGVNKKKFFGVLTAIAVEILTSKKLIKTVIKLVVLFCKKFGGEHPQAPPCLHFM